MNERKLNRIIKESIRKTLMESSCADNLSTAESALSELVNSGFIPFSSPSPSSTELKLKRYVEDALRNIQMAKRLCCDLGYCQNDSLMENKFTDKVKYCGSKVNNWIKKQNDPRYYAAPYNDDDPEAFDKCERSKKEADDEYKRKDAEARKKYGMKPKSKKK